MNSKNTVHDDEKGEGRIIENGNGMESVREIELGYRHHPNNYNRFL